MSYCMLNTGEFINLCLHLCSISIATFLTTVLIPHLAERRPNHCFQISASSERASVKLFVMGYALHSTGLQSNMPLQSDRIKFSKFSNLKDWLRKAKQDDLSNTQRCIAMFPCRELKSESFLRTRHCKR